MAMLFTSHRFYTILGFILFGSFLLLVVQRVDSRPRMESNEDEALLQAPRPRYVRDMDPDNVPNPSLDKQEPEEQAELPLIVRYVGRNLEDPEYGYKI